MLVLNAAYEQQWLTLAEEYHDHLKDMSAVPIAGAQEAAVRQDGGQTDDWRVQIFRLL